MTHGHLPPILVDAIRSLVYLYRLAALWAAHGWHR